MAIRNIEDLSIGDITEDLLREECIEMGDELGVDTNQGSLYRDAAEGHITRVAKFFNDLNSVATIISIHTCTGDILDEYLMQRGIARNPPVDTPATYYVDFVGAEPEIGDTMTVDEHMFSTDKLDGRWVIISEETGTSMNNLVLGIPVVPERDVDNLASATLQELAIPAVDMESDESARERFIKKVSGPSENGNKTEIQAWCEGIEGVGRAKVVPLWQGDCTVLAVIISSDGKAPTEEVVSLVQETIDPGAEGMGEGMATIGCHFTAIAAVEAKINVVVDVSTKSGSLYDVGELVKESVTSYLKDLALHSYTDEVTVRYNSISSLIQQIDSVVDHDNLRLNGGTENVVCDINHVPVIGEVTVNGGI